MRVSKTSTEESFWKLVTKTDTCWLYGRVGQLRYGGFRLHGARQKCISAHRLSWELHHGQIPDGLWVLHKCDVRQCVNPAHLFLGTPKDNVLDMLQKYRSPIRRVTDAQIKEIRAFASTAVKNQRAVNYPKLAKRFGVSVSAIGKIVRGDSWKHVT